jgi:monoamine oxidase/SAM-dependent methyltransferase
MYRIAIIGGGPGGLMTAHHLEQKYGTDCTTTVFEASGRTGGKMVTSRFSTVPVMYEAGVAEIYNYAMVGPDPLRQLIESLGLKTVPMDGETVVLDGRILNNRNDIRRKCGEATLKAIDEFRARAEKALPKDRWYDGNWKDDNEHPLAKMTCAELLETVPDDTARKFFKVAAHSDLATEPHLTNGLNGIKNFLMDVPGYMDLYSIVGGIELLPLRLRESLTRVEFVMEAPVVKVERTEKGTYLVHFRQNRVVETREFDAVFVSLAHNWLNTVEWGGEKLRRAMTRHISYYDRPAHYVRVSVLFETPFWRKKIKGSWFMSDAFGGCCVYDEGARHDVGPYGVLGWLLGGTDALTYGSFDDERLIAEAIASLPDELHELAKSQKIEAKVHRWLASVNAQPGGYPMQDIRASHMPEPEEHDGLYVVGDYLFDSTLNGVLDSADYATDLFYSLILKRDLFRITAGLKRPCLNGHGNGNGNGNGNGHANGNGHSDEKKKTKVYVPPLIEVTDTIDPARFLQKTRIDRDYFDRYHDNESYEDTFDEYFDAKYVRDLIKIVWGEKPPYKLLDAGSANGLTLEEFAEYDIKAWGVEKSKYIHAQTPKYLRKRNLLGDVRKLPFPDNHFDFVYETCLGYVPENELERAISELHRVARVGVIFASITCDMNPELFKRRNLLRGVKTLMSLWEWGEVFQRYGFSLAIDEDDDKTLARLWKCEEKYNQGDDRWYPDLESLRFCFYSKE